ncbi:glycoside hydrolase family 16 protein [Kitasatospora indigofera]|uniref:glycoside hydrolase family 16 protein n=1 Tax=Kitasatospora indigofera TaxID=67307 RepID=UPI003646EB99
MSSARPASRRPHRIVPRFAVPMAVLCAATACTSTAGPAPTPSMGTTPATAPAPTPTPSTPAGPPGVLFDSFRYTGPDDPALTTNGWTVRTDGGGPGIRDTWTKDGLSFPVTDGAKGGRAMQLRLATDGTPKGTQQLEVGRTEGEFANGTVAARVYFSDRPAAGGRAGDHINECFYAISPSHASPKYSELDFEYMPNGGWDATGPRIDTTSWRSSTQGDRDTRSTKRSLAGWHTMMMTAENGNVTYSMDGRALFASDSKTFPREPLSIRFSAWLIDLPAAVAGPRTWDMKVNWLYQQADKTLSLAEVTKTVDGFYAAGTAYVNTVPKR